MKHVRADTAGGIVSAAIAIPLAMGYGMFAFTSLGENYFADGAIANVDHANAEEHEHVRDQAPMAAPP